MQILVWLLNECNEHFFVILSYCQYLTKISNILIAIFVRVYSEFSIVSISVAWKIGNKSFPPVKVMKNKI
jgi:hypothetical protein